MAKRAANLYIAIVVNLLCHAAVAQIPGDAPAPEQILEQVKAIGEPDFDAARKQEPGYLDNYKREQHLLYRKKAALLLELCRLYPEHSQMAEWMNRRWVLLGWNQKPEKVADEVLADIDAVLVHNLNRQVEHAAAYWRAYFRAHKHAGDPDEVLKSVRPFLESYPSDARGAELLALVAYDERVDQDRRISLFRRIARDYPETHDGTYAPGMIRRLEAIGQPFKVAFNDVITGRPISTDALRGKVVLIDFWATTCVPCVAELPTLKTLYDKYRDHGVEFIGISLDESETMGGRQALVAFVTKHGIAWPQYYQGDGYDSDFSKSWGVGSAPTIFLLDRQGRLRYPNAVDHADELITSLLRE